MEIDKVEMYDAFKENIDDQIQLSDKSQMERNVSNSAVRANTIKQNENFKGVKFDREQRYKSKLILNVFCQTEGGY